MIASQEIRLYTFMFLELLKDHEKKSQAINELGVLVDRLTRDTKLMSFLSSSEVTDDEKSNYIEKKFSKIYNFKEVIHFLKLLVSNNRHKDIKEIYKSLTTN